MANNYLNFYYRRGSDATTQVIDLDDKTTYSVVDYVTKTAGSDDDYVEDRIVIHVGGTAVTTFDLLCAAVDALGEIFRYARQCENTGIGFVYLSNNKDGNNLGSTIFDGRLEHANRMWYEDYANKATDVTLIIKRLAYWQKLAGVSAVDDAENPNGADIDSYDPGVKIYNCNDLVGAAPNKRCNYIDLPTGLPTSGIPAFIDLRIQNTVNDSEEIRNIWMAMNVNENPATMVHNIECEDGTGGTPTADADCSAGDYMAITWTEVVEKQLTAWTLTGANQLLYGGGNYKILLRLKTAPTLTNLYLKFKIMDGTTVLADSGWQLASDGDQIQEVGVLRIPPSLSIMQLTAMGDVSLVLFAKTVEAGTKALDADFIMLFPLDDGYCKYTMITSDMGYQDCLLDAEYIYNLSYPLVSVGGSPEVLKQAVIRQGGPIRTPVNQRVRFYFLHDITDGTAAITRTMLVKIGWHLRKLTI